MKPLSRDIPRAMESVAAAEPEPRRGGLPRACLSHREFSARFEESRRTLWLIAAGVLGRRDDADDCLQDAAMIGVQKIRDFDPQTSFPAWMGGIVRNVARNHARKHARRHTAPADPLALDQARPAPAEPPPPLPTPRPGATLTPDDGPFDDAVLHALNTLDETARTCLLLRILHDMPYRDIALWVGVPEGTAMSHVHRSRQALRRELGEARR